MPTRSNEQLCRLAQAGDTAARDILLESNLGFIRKIALEQYRSMGLDENDIGIDLDDLVQEGSIGLLNAIPLFDAGRGMKFLTYAAPAIRNAMTDCIRAALAQFEQRMVDKKNGPGFQRVYLDDILSDDERMLRIEAIADPHTQTPEQIYICKNRHPSPICTRFEHHFHALKPHLHRRSFSDTLPENQRHLIALKRHPLWHMQKLCQLSQPAELRSTFFRNRNAVLCQDVLQLSNPLALSLEFFLSCVKVFHRLTLHLVVAGPFQF